MSYRDGWAAINLEMPDRVPRTEYSVQHLHLDLISKVTGIHVDPSSPQNEKDRATRAFVRAWNYDMFWTVSIYRDVFGEVCTRMGHASYAAGGTDYDDEVGSPFEDPSDVLTFDPWQALGSRNKSEIIHGFNQYYRSCTEWFPDCVNMSGVYISLVSGLLDLFGWDLLLMTAGTSASGLGEVADRYASWVQQYFDALAESDAPVVMVHDDIVWTSGAFLHPEWYRKYVFPNYKKFFAPLKDHGKRILFTSDGNYTEFVDDIAGCGVHGFVLEPCTDMEYMAEKYGRSHVIVGNADTRVLLSGDKAEIRAEVERCMNIGKKCPGFFMAVGNHIPPNTPVESALYYNEVYEEMSRR